MSTIFSQENRYMESPYRIQDSSSIEQVPFNIDSFFISEEEFSETVKEKDLETEEKNFLQ